MKFIQISLFVICSITASISSPINEVQEALNEIPDLNRIKPLRDIDMPILNKLDIEIKLMDAIQQYDIDKEEMARLHVIRIALQILKQRIENAQVNLEKIGDEYEQHKGDATWLQRAANSFIDHMAANILIQSKIQL